jgi:hypothetical protein
MSSIRMRALISGAALLGAAGLIGASTPMALAAPAPRRTATAGNFAKVVNPPSFAQLAGNVVRVPAPMIIVTPIEEP